MHNHKLKRLSVFILALVLTLTSVLAINDNVTFATKQPTKTEVLKVHYIDVGQGDSIFIELPNGQTSLIDGGPGSNSKTVVNYLKKQNVKKIDYLIATHPHEDHIGGLPEVIKSFDIGSIYMPDITHTTKAFENLLLAIKNKGKKITITKAGDELINEKNLKYEALAPSSDSYDNLNNYSIVLKLKYKNNAFLFMGDAEKPSEDEILAAGYDIKADVIKVGHHGSNSSSGGRFITNVSPHHAVVSCGKGNSYGHPHKETVNRFTGNNIKLYRTDRDGTIVFTSDGNKITVTKLGTQQKPNNKNTSPAKSTAPKTNKKPPTGSTSNKESTVYITNTGSKYHRSGCRYLKKSKIPIKLSEAKSQGYTPCKVCNP
ncbi:ComEC/Rec2 family competence protein [Clostridium sp. Cult2]|uniref:ComEC/Rec2 family competence protein n=1 Tax=Clostridium sp. Cult2 TaxID=2079003 RepID=UPI001F457AA7|nr:ComEC/Rec2 family competence protein [Clostridium sp. Cult2]MCF6466390.1 MBL fold metallo-hydrolase [Clostridium sp. Cult2]